MLDYCLNRMSIYISIKQ
uniref:Uncharacterized protein n=1 Tax=Arundo donax TaxID=35708 RepID=A0A0A8YDJ3_ARUDO